MSMSIELHNVSKITAEAFHGESAHWVELTFEFKSTFRKVSPANIGVFFNDTWMADTLADAVNSANNPRVARTTVELMQQLRDSVALCDAERAPWE